MSERPPTTRLPTRGPEPHDERSNILFGLGLFAIFLLLFAGTAVVAFVYLALD